MQEPGHAVGHDLGRHDAHVALEAASADRSDGLAGFANEQPGTLAPVCGPAHGDDGRERHPLACVAPFLDCPKDLLELAHGGNRVPRDR